MPTLNDIAPRDALSNLPVNDKIAAGRRAIFSQYCIFIIKLHDRNLI